MADLQSPKSDQIPQSSEPADDPNPTQSGPPQPDPSIQSQSAPNPNPTPAITPPPPPILSPSFRPVAPPVVPPTVAAQFSPLPNPNFQNPPGVHVQPPGVTVMPPMSGAMPPVSGGVMPPQYAGPPGQPRMYQMPNGYQGMPMPMPGAVPPPGILRYGPPYASMIRPAFPLRPPIGIIPAMSRPPIMGVRGPVMPIVRPPIMPSVTPAEKPQTTVYVGKIATTVENDFIQSLLQLCGPVKSWKRAQDPSTGAFKGFGFCEFESAEGVLRALRLLSKLSIDGQELMLNVNQATREYLERYVEKKKENSKNLKAAETEGSEKEEGSEAGVEKSEPPKASAEEPKEEKEEGANKEDEANEKDEANKEDEIANFGIVTSGDKEGDLEASEKMTGMIEERIKTKPLPPPPPSPPPQSGTGWDSNYEVPAKSEWDSDLTITKKDSAERNDEEMTSDSKPPSEHERHERSSPDRSRKTDRRSRDRDRDRDLKYEKERELERYEREREQERIKREREREYKIREDERRYRTYLKEWESREKERERARKQEKEREKEREKDRKDEIMEQEYESDDAYSKKRKYKNTAEEREERKRRMREKEEDLADRKKEQDEIAEAKRRAEVEREQQKEQEKNALELLSRHSSNGIAKAVLPDEAFKNDNTVEQTPDGVVVQPNDIDNGAIQNGSGDDSGLGSLSTADARVSNNVQTKKLEFGLAGLGKRTAVPSVFHEEEDEDAQKEKKLRPLVPIDYSTEELQAVRDTTPAVPSPSLAEKAAEYAKRTSHASSKDERSEPERDRSRRAHDRHGQRDREDTSRPRDESRKETGEWDKDRDRGTEKAKIPDNKKLLDAKQLIDTIPKTKDELFSYPINWSTYDKNGLHERMRPWISKKITEFLGEEEPSLVDFIVCSTQEHVKASEMLVKLETILDDEAEMFVLKMWRMLIFEIKKVETGLASRSKS